MRIAIYSRKSIETDTGESIKNQIKLCQEYFSRQYKDCIFEVFEDEGFSGGNINRPDFKRMMGLVKIKQFDVIAVYKIDRIARNIVDFVNIYDELDKLGVKLVSITEGFDPSTPAGKMMMLLLASFAEMERMNIAQRVKDNMRELAKMGRWSGGTPPTGYVTQREFHDGKNITYLKLSEDQAVNIKAIFEKYAEGFTTYQINKYFKEKGIDFPQKTIQNILANPTYLKSSQESVKYLETHGYIVYGEPNGFGFLPYNRRPKTKGVKSWNDKSKFVGISKHDAIVDLDLWIAVQEKLVDRCVAPHPRESEFTFLSGGIIKCKCGASMFVSPGRARKNGDRVFYFRCMDRCGNKFLRVDIAERMVNDYLKELTKKEILLQHMNGKYNKPDVIIEIENINKKISSNNKAINNLIDKLVLLSNDASKFITDRIEKMSNENVLLKEELLKLEREKMFIQIDKNNIEILYRQITDFVELDQDIESKRRKIKTIIKEATWASEENKLRVELL